MEKYRVWRPFFLCPRLVFGGGLVSRCVACLVLGRVAFSCVPCLVGGAVCLPVCPRVSVGRYGRCVSLSDMSCCLVAVSAVCVAGCAAPCGVYIGVSDHLGLFVLYYLPVTVWVRDIIRVLAVFRYEFILCTRCTEKSCEFFR